MLKANLGLLRNPPGQDEGGVFFSKRSKRKFWEGSSKYIIQENIVWTENRNLGRYVDSFELLRFFEMKFCIINQGKNCKLYLEICLKTVRSRKFLKGNFCQI